MKIAIIGAGNMGGSIARALAGSSKSREIELMVSNPSQGKLDRLSADHSSIAVTCDNREAARDADVVILAVKPWLVEPVLSEIQSVIDFDRHLLVSVAAGISLDCLREMTGNARAMVFNVIPNTAVSVGEGMSFITSAGADEESRQTVKEIFSLMGEAMEIDERQMDACMALASCGIAYVMRYVRASVEGAVELGLAPSVAQRVMLQTMRGAAALLEKTGNNPETEIDRVTTPGGLTIRGLNAMEEAGFTASVIKGLRASVKH